MEDYVVHIIVLGAALFLARWLYKNLANSSKGDAACGSCDSCAPESDAKAGDEF